jgi:hypothetical protein
MALDGADIESIQIATLHDVLEENETISPEEIEERFGREVKDGVSLMSKSVQGVHKNLDEYYAELKLHPKIRKVKVYDSIDNMKAWSRQEGDDTKRDYKILETLHLITPLASSDQVLLDKLEDALRAVEDASGKKGITEGAINVKKTFLEEKLKTNGIDMSSWGNGDTRTARDLATEVLNGESSITEDNEGNLLRVVGIVSVDIIYVDPISGQTYRLEKDFQGFFGRSLYERLRSYDEGDILYTVRRACAKELEIFNIDEDNIDIKDMETETRPTITYPGLMSNFRIHPAVVRLRPSQFKPEGYIDRQEGNVIHFSWTALPQNGASV